jgi:hypothetical protein
MRSSLFCHVTQLILVLSDVSGPVPETSVTTSLLCVIFKEREYLRRVLIHHEIILMLN